ncbi:hypothetical protein GCM10025867_39810 [Frondihabitans sucicola]|uniref:Uncharacterized protein n=1 Tax=Frondihabitans sucicola TaxID=1268041 RepID=A0ABN6Y6X4_9MICO|nr:hypothetical protein [Frondihabitans sucicola]BDZ51740.1 hypothetical protein GCM10025867_39810 [Frondihabitans sucicola]
MVLTDSLVAQLSVEARVTCDPTGRDGVVAVAGDVHVGTLAAIVLDHAAEVVMAARYLGTVAAPGRAATPHEIAAELRRQADVYRVGIE